jgi:hypothetical protein
VNEVPDRPVIDLQAAFGELSHKPAGSSRSKRRETKIFFLPGT